MGIASLVLGIISVFMCLILAIIYAAPIAFIPAITGIVFGAIARKKSREENRSDGIASAGFIVSIASVGFIAIISVSCYGCLYCAQKISKSFSESEYFKKMQESRKDPEYRKNQEEALNAIDDFLEELIKEK